MAFSDDLRRALDRVHQKELERTARDIAAAARSSSETVASTLIVEDVERVRRRTSKGYVTSPFFWSRILDQGRRGFSVKRARVLVWFEDPLRDDPRLGGRWHRTRREANAARLRLDSETFRFLVKSGKIRLARSVGPVAPANFVREGTRDTVRNMRSAIQETTAVALRGQLRRILGNGQFKARNRF